jgi:hypothetical protein
MNFMNISNHIQASLPEEILPSPQPEPSTPRSISPIRAASDSLDVSPTPSGQLPTQHNQNQNQNLHISLSPSRSRFPFHPFEWKGPSDFPDSRRNPGGTRLATVNVQSIKDLMDMVINVMHAWELDILVLVETWLRGEEADALAASVFYGSNGARAFSTVAPETENRHLGVTLILGEQMARHYQSMDTVEGTAIRVKLRWRRTELHIIAVYIPPRWPKQCKSQRDDGQSHGLDIRGRTRRHKRTDPCHSTRGSE